MAARVVTLSRSCACAALFLLLGGCAPEEQKPLQSVRSAPATAAPRVVDPAAARVDEEAGVQALGAVRDDTPEADPALVFLREDPRRLRRPKVVLQIERNPESLRNPELARIVREFYLSEHRAGRFWNQGVWLLARTGDQAQAAMFLAHWEATASTEITKGELAGWGAFDRMTQEPKYVLSMAIFALGERSSQERIWRAFPALNESDQRVVAWAARGALDTPTAGAMIHLLDSAKSEEARQDLVYAANNILYQVLSTKGINGDWVEMETRPLIEELSRRGLVRDFLGKLLGK